MNEYEKNIRQLTENIDAIIWRFDLINDKWLYVSPQIEQILGYMPEDWVNLQSWIDIIHPDDRLWAPSFCHSQTQMGLPHNFEYRVFHKNGTVIWIFDKVGVEMVNNQPAYLYGVMIDITKQKENELAVKENELRLQSLVRIFQFETETIHELLDYTLHEAIELTKSKFGYIYFFSEEEEQFTLFSWSKDVMKECMIVEKQTIYHLKNTGIWGEAVRQRKPIIVNDFQAFNPLKKGYPEGHVRLSKFLTIPIFDAKEIVAVIGVANKESDFTNSDVLHLTVLMDNTWKIFQKKKFEELILLHNEKLTKINKDKDRLMSILSHDLKNPFNPILGYLDLLTSNLNNYDITKIDKQLSIINESAKRYYELLDRLSLWIRSQSGRMHFHSERLNLHKVCSDVILELETLSNSKKIFLSQVIDKNMHAFADVNMLKIILHNLLNNAIKFTNASGRIEIKAESRDSNAVISITDNGVGIDAQVLDDLFDFSKVKSTPGTDNETGTGLGIAICKEFIEKLDGKIWIESVKGQGTTMFFTLPLSNEPK